MQITVEPRENFTILHLRGEFDTFYCAHLQQEVEGLAVETGRGAAPDPVEPSQRPMRSSNSRRKLEPRYSSRRRCGFAPNCRSSSRNSRARPRAGENAFARASQVIRSHTRTG